MNTEQILQIPLDQVYPSPGNRRVGGFDPKKLDQLADSIKAVGVQQPAVVRLKDNGQGKYEIVAGERRWRAARIAGIEALPCVVREIDDLQVLKIQTIENLQREDVHPLDEANGYAQLIEQAQYDAEILAQEVGKSLSYVYQRLKLLDLIEPGQKMLIGGKITAGHAILIARLPPGQQKQVLKSHIFQRSDLPSVRELDDYIHRTVLLDLSKATFKRDDAELVPSAGPCLACPKRTGFQPELFADVCNGGKHDYCTDPTCFEAKLDALVKQRRQELKGSGEKHLEVIDGYGLNYNEIQRLEKAGVKDNHAWEECKKSDEGAVQVLVVAGNSPGRLTWGRERKQTRYGGYAPSTAEKKAREKKLLEAKVKAVIRRRTWDTVLAELEAKGVYKKMPVELLRMIAVTYWKRTMDNVQAAYCKAMEWEEPPRKPDQYGHPWERMGTSRIATMEAADLFHFLLTLSLAPDLEGPVWRETECWRLKEVAALYQLDVKKLEAEVKKEYEEKAKAKEERVKKAAKAKKKAPAKKTKEKVEASKK